MHSPCGIYGKFFKSLFFLLLYPEELLHRLLNDTFGRAPQKIKRDDLLRRGIGVSFVSRKIAIQTPGLNIPTMNSHDEKQQKNLHVFISPWKWSKPRE